MVKFYYNDRGHRVKKEQFFQNGLDLQNTFHYVRDAAGSIMAIYTNTNLAEQPIYGSGRIGVAYNGTGNNRAYVYELTDHLGNVRAVVEESGATASGTDYYPFGMPMPARNVQGDYRYAYQGQEKDGETGMEAFELRLWDARIGRWLTTDPYGQYASPYLGMGNNPINGIDPDGGFWEELLNWIGGKGWNSNAALDFQANGGELGEWVGNKFTGYRSGYFQGADAESSYGTAFGAVDDFWNYDTFDFQGRVAIGQLNQVSFDLDNGVGIGGAANWSKVMFLGGDYGNYWYTYTGEELGFNGGFAFGGSVDVSTELFIAIYQDKRVNSPSPRTFAGDYGSGAIDAEIHAGAGLSGFVSRTYGGGWKITSLGVGVGGGGNLKVAGELRLGKSYLQTPTITPTNDRGVWDIISNKLIHSTPLY